MKRLIDKSCFIDCTWCLSVIDVVVLETVFFCFLTKVSFTYTASDKNLKAFTIDNNIYYLSSDRAQFSDVPSRCESHNMTELFIESNQEFSKVRKWVSDNSVLDNTNIWIKTNKKSAKVHTWNDGTLISKDAWMVTLNRGEVEPNYFGGGCDKSPNGCCVYLSSSWGSIEVSLDRRHYLMDNRCNHDNHYICVKENSVETTTIMTTSPSTTKTKSTTTPSPNTTTIEPSPNTTAESLPPNTTATLQNTTSQTNETTELSTRTQTTDAIPSVFSTQTSQLQLCPCSCGNRSNVNLSSTDVIELLDNIQQELHVNPVALSSRRNKKESAKDYRTASVAMGVFAISLCAVPLVVIVGLDMTHLVDLFY